MNKEKFAKLTDELSTEQCVYFNMLSIEALVDMLICKGICSREDILESLKQVKQKQDDYVTNLIENERKED